MRVVFLILLTMASSCGGAPEVIKGEYVSETRIKWIRGIEKNCGGALSPLGCAFINYDGCTITMPEEASDEIVAHEFKHCFGYVHKP